MAFPDSVVFIQWKGIEVSHYANRLPGWLAQLGKIRLLSGFRNPATEKTSNDSTGQVVFFGFFWNLLEKTTSQGPSFAGRRVPDLESMAEKLWQCNLGSAT